MAVIKFYPDPLDWAKDQIFKFHNISVVNIFTEISDADKGPIDMKHVKQDFSLKAWVRPPGGLEGIRGQN